jgi:hypothetical protein
VPRFGSLAPSCALALALASCGDTERNAVHHADPAAGGAGEAGESSSGGTLGGVGGSSGSGGRDPVLLEAGAAGDPGAGGTADAGSAGTPGSGGSSGAASGGTAGGVGSGGSGGGSGGTAGGCEPAPVCGDLGPCDAGWDASCGPGDSPSCCDGDLGIIKDCFYGGGGIQMEEFVAVNSCTFTSFGTGSCTGCINPSDPHCDDSWRSGGCAAKVFCSHPELGFRQSCEDLDASSYLRVECVCDPDA